MFHVSSVKWGVSRIQFFTYVDKPFFENILDCIQNAYQTFDAHISAKWQQKCATDISKF